MRKFILGTDWWTDCDDAVALRLICRFVKNGKAELLGVGINAVMEHSAASLLGFLRAEGLENVPVGIDLSAVDYGGRPPYQKHLAETTGMTVKNEALPDAVRLYRKILEDATEKLEIMEIGFFQVIPPVVVEPVLLLPPLLPELLGLLLGGLGLVVGGTEVASHSW